jgi:hypothetical protein
VSDPIVLEPGEVITEAGQYVMGMDHYHSQCCIGPSFSSSGLRTIFHQSPADFWAYSDLNELRFEKDTADHFVFGRAAHALLLGDEDFHATFAVVPRTAPPRPMASQIAARNAGRITDAAKERFEFWDPFEIENHGKEFLTETDFIHIEHIADKLAECPEAQILLEGRREHSLVWQDAKTGLWLKSRIDVLSGTGDFADIKSTVQKNERLIQKSIRESGYDMQLALGTVGVEEVLGIPFTAENYESRSAILIFVHKSPPYHIMPFEVSFEALNWARLKVRAAIDTAAKCILEDRWPGPLDGLIPQYTPAFELESLLQMQTDGRLPLSYY